MCSVHVWSYEDQAYNDPLALGHETRAWHKFKLDNHLKQHFLVSALACKKKNCDHEHRKVAGDSGSL